MEWWIWVLIGIGGYLVTGLTVSAFFAYYLGRTQQGYDSDDTFFAVMIWPLAVSILVYDWYETLCKWMNQRGRSSKERKTAKRDARALAEVAKELGIPVKNLK